MADLKQQLDDLGEQTPKHPTGTLKLPAGDSSATTVNTPTSGQTASLATTLAV